MEAMDFDALVYKNQGFNKMDDNVNSVINQAMTQQTLNNIQAMQTSMPQGHIPQHVVLPIFQKEAAQKDNGQSLQFFVIIGGVQKGPFTLEQVKGLAIADVIDENTQVWMSGLPNWTDLKTCLSTLNK